MSQENDDLLGEWLESKSREIEPPAPNPEPVPPYRPSPSPSGNWLTIALACLVAYIAIGDRIGCKRTTPDDRDDDSVVIDESGSYALIIQDKTPDGQARLSDGQKAAINSSAVFDIAKEAGFELRIFDKRDDLSTVETVWQKLADIADDPPSLTASKDGTVTTGKLPDGVSKVREALESIK